MQQCMARLRQTSLEKSILLLLHFNCIYERKKEREREKHKGAVLASLRTDLDVFCSIQHSVLYLKAKRRPHERVISLGFLTPPACHLPIDMNEGPKSNDVPLPWYPTLKLIWRTSSVKNQFLVSVHHPSLVGNSCVLDFCLELPLLCEGFHWTARLIDSPLFCNRVVKQLILHAFVSFMLQLLPWYHLAS